MEKIDPAVLLDNLAAGAWYADAGKTLQYLNREALANHPDVAAALGRSIDDCHNPGSVAKIDRMYENWRRGGREVAAYSRSVKEGQKHNILIPVHGSNGFEGVLEITFVTPE